MSLIFVNYPSLPRLHLWKRSIEGKLSKAKGYQNLLPFWNIVFCVVNIFFQYSDGNIDDV